MPLDYTQPVIELEAQYLVEHFRRLLVSVQFFLILVGRLLPSFSRTGISHALTPFSLKLILLLSFLAFSRFLVLRLAAGVRVFCDRAQVGLQRNQVAFAAPAENQMPQELGNGVKASLIPKEDPRGKGKGKGKATASASRWPHRVKWNGYMTKLLVSAVAYVDADIDAGHGGSRVKRMGKWRIVSSSMTKRGFAASPQQCEDKFHDLNKRYKRVTEILGFGTACGVVKKPALLEQMKLSEKLKEEARKLLSSKNLHYEEMCSYHNRNRHSLLDDPSLQRMLWSMARGRSPVELGIMECRTANAGDTHMVLPDVVEERGDESNDDLVGSAEEGCHPSRDAASDMKEIQIKRERLKIRREMVEMMQSHMKQMRSIMEQDRELLKMKLDNEMKELENDKLELELERKIKDMEMMGIKPKRIL